MLICPTLVGPFFSTRLWRVSFFRFSHDDFWLIGFGAIWTLFWVQHARVSLSLAQALGPRSNLSSLSLGHFIFLPLHPFSNSPPMMYNVSSSSFWTWLFVYSSSNNSSDPLFPFLLFPPSSIPSPWDTQMEQESSSEMGARTSHIGYFLFFYYDTLKCLQCQCFTSSYLLKRHQIGTCSVIHIF